MTFVKLKDLNGEKGVISVRGKPTLIDNKHLKYKAKETIEIADPNESQYPWVLIAEEHNMHIYVNKANGLIIIEMKIYHKNGYDYDDYGNFNWERVHEYQG